MGLEVRHFDGGRGVLFRYWGVVDDDEYLRVLASHIFDDPERFRGYRYHLSDTTDVEKLSLSTLTLKRATAACRDAAQSNPDAIVSFVTPSALSFGLGRMFEMLVDPLIAWDFHVFKTRPEAESWIRQRCRERFGLDDVPLVEDPGVIVPNDVVPKNPI